MVFQVCGPLLTEDGSVGVIGGIGFHPVSDVRVWVGKYWGGGNYVFEGLEHCFFSGCPCPWAVVFCEVMEGSGNVCEPLDEASVEVAEPDEFLYALDLGGGFPFVDCTALVLVHAEPVPGEFHAKEVDLVLVKLALFGVEDDSCLSAELEEFSDCWNMAVMIGCMDVGVIQVAQNGVDDFGFVVQVVIDKFLEVGGSIHQTEGEDIGLEGAVWCVKSR